MNNRQSIKLADVKVTNRFRKEMGDIPSLADSIARYGLVQPIVLTPDHTLVAGERRYRAHQQLGLERIDFVYVEEMPEDVKKELEFEENFWRKNMTWQEECLGILDIHRKKRLRGAAEGWSWGQQQAAEMFGMSVGTINYVLAVAKRLETESKLPEEKRKFWNYGSVAEAYRLGILGEEEDRLNAILARRAQEAASAKAIETQRAVEAFKQSIDVTPNAVFHDAGELQKVLALRERAKGDYLSLSRDEARTLYLSNQLNPPDGFDAYYKEKVDLLTAANTVDLSAVAIQTDCIEFMKLDENKGRFDHIITDPPYAIDMSMLDQENTGMTDIDRVAEAHDVKENMELISRFFPAAWKCTKEQAFVVVCCDIMVWQHLYACATAAGFAVQRWPLVWRKVNQSVSNGAAQYNTTKDFELVMVCRKPRTVLAKKRSSSIIDASNVEATKLTGHPFAKPFELTATLIDTFTFENQTILEPFAGGGSMAIEILRQKRQVVAIEKETHHYNSLLENLKQQYYLKLNPKFLFK